MVNPGNTTHGDQMKQGRATTSMVGSTKTEPKSNAVNPGAVSRMGNMVGPGTKSESLYEGRGLKAPMVGSTAHKAGSQGKH